MPLPWNRPDLLQVWTWPQKLGINMFFWWADWMTPRRLQPLFKGARAVLTAGVMSFIFSISTAVGIVTLSEGTINLFLIFELIATYLGSFNMFAIIHHRNRLKEAMDILDALLIEAHSKIDKKLDEFIRRRHSRNWIINFLFMSYNIVLTIQWLIVPVLLTLSSGQKILIAPTWPLFANNWAQYIATYAYQVACVSNFALAIAVFPSLYISISEESLVEAGIRQDILRFYTVVPSIFASSLLHFVFAANSPICRRVCYLLRDSSVGVIIVQTTLTSLALCIAVFEYIYDNDADGKILQNIAQVAIELLCMMFIYCWYSSEICHKSRDVVSDLYSTNWEDWDVRDRKRLVIVASMSHKPLIFGGIVDINLNSFINVIKTAFTYYNFMEAMHVSK